MIRLFKSRVYISPFAVALAAVISLSVDALFFFSAIPGALIHEFSHTAVMKMYGAEIISVSIYPFGVDIKSDTSGLSATQEIAVYLAGPLASLLTGLSALMVYGYAGGIYVLFFALSNLVFFVVNILPVKGLDGARALYVLLSSKYEYIQAQRIYEAVTAVFFGMLCIMAMFLVYFSGYNLSLVFICIYLFISEYTRQRLCHNRFV